MHATPGNELAPSRIVAIAGASCSGKTTLAHAIVHALKPGVCTIISLDSYYRDLSHLPFDERAQFNFDHPDAFDWALVAEHIETLASGRPVHSPRYDFTSHTRREETSVVEPAPIVMLEGLLALHHRSIRELSDLRIFLHADEAVCLERRLRRDIAERGRTEQCVRAQYDATVRPMATQFVIPSRAYADLDLNGAVALDALVGFVLEWLPESLRR